MFSNVSIANKLCVKERVIGYPEIPVLGARYYDLQLNNW